MGFWNYYPRTDFHELNLDWIMRELQRMRKDLDDNIISVQEYYKEVLALFADITAGVEEIVDEYLSTAENIALRSDLTSNDIDIEEVYTYHFVDGRRTPEDSVTHLRDTNFIVFQSMVVMNDRYFVTIANDENGYTNNCRIRIYDSNGAFVTSGDVVAGHAQDATTNGTDRIYICYSIDASNTASSKVAVVAYPTLAVIDTIDLPMNISRICYNPDKKQFILGKDKNQYIFDENLTYQIDTYELPWEFADYYANKKFGSVSRQGTFYYNNMIAYIYSYPNAICFYDLDTHELVKMYNPPYTIGAGGIFDEIEDGYIDQDGTLWLTSFYVDGDARMSANVIAKVDFWKNVQTLYRKYARDIAPLNIYVDGNTNQSTEYGTKEHPYKTLTQAVASLKSYAGNNTPITIYCKENTNVGTLRATQIVGINILPYDENGQTGQGANYYIQGVRLIGCADVYIHSANILYNSELGNGNNSSCLIDRTPLALLVNCDISGNQNSNYTSFGVADYGLYASDGSNVTLRACDFANNTIGSIIASTGATVIYDADCTLETLPFRQHFAKVMASGTKYHPDTARYSDAFPEVETYVLSNDTLTATGSYDLFEHTSNISSEAKTVINYLVFDCGTSGKHSSQFVRVPSNIETTLNFVIPVPTGSGTIGTISGDFTMSTGVLNITQISSGLRIYMVQAI